jgi:hypothetical protein
MSLTQNCLRFLCVRGMYPVFSVSDPDPQLALLDLDPYCECRSGYRRKEIDQKLQLNLISSHPKWLLFLRRYVLSLKTYRITYVIKHIFHVKIQVFVTAKFFLGSGSVWLCIGLALWIRIRIEVKLESGSALKLTRIRNTAWTVAKSHSDSSAI